MGVKEIFGRPIETIQVAHGRYLQDPKELPTAFAEDDVDDYRGSDDGGDCIEGNDTRLARKHADDVAQQGNDSTAEHGGWHEPAMVIGGKQ